MFNNQSGYQPYQAAESSHVSSSAKPIQTPPNKQQSNESSFNEYLASVGYPANYSLKCHGDKFAFEIKPDKTKSNWHTVRLEAAARIEGQRAYDWRTKIGLQLTQKELPLVAGFFLTLLQNASCKYHGAQNNKGFDGHFQGNSVFASMHEAGKQKMGVKMSFVDSMMFGHLCLAQYSLNYPNITTDVAYQSIKMLSNRMQPL